MRVRGADSLGRAGVGRGELGADEGMRSHSVCRARVPFANIEQVIIFITRVTSRTFLGQLLSCVNHVPSVAEHEVTSKTPFRCRAVEDKRRLRPCLKSFNFVLLKDGSSAADTTPS